MSRVVVTQKFDPAKPVERRAAPRAARPEMLQKPGDAGLRGYRVLLRPDGLLVGSLETQLDAGRRGSSARPVAR